MAEHRDDGLLHGRELDECMVDLAGPDELGICPSALHSRTGQHIDQQLDFATDPEELAVIRKELLDVGAPFDEDTVRLIQLRSAIGGSFTYGIAVGLKLAARQEADRG